MRLKTFLTQSIVMPLAIAAYKGHPLRGVPRYLSVLREFQAYRKMSNGSSESISLRNFYPWLVDKYGQAGYVDPYFYQDTWCARKIFESRPALHVDVGSSLMTAGILSQFCDLTYVDIRPLSVSLPGLTFKQGDLLSLPFEPDSVESLSSLSVVEHVGLGRYGDSLDPHGTDKACSELSRILRLEGALYVAVPTAKIAATYFNAHRIFNPDEFIAKFPGLVLTEERYGTSNGIFGRSQYEMMGMPEAYGCFCFTKTASASYKSN